jgi:hypothetical protein
VQGIAGLDHRLVHLPDSRAALGHKILIRNAVRCDTLPFTIVLGETMIKAVLRRMKWGIGSSTARASEAGA